MKRGAAWEFELERWHARYATALRAWVVKTNPEASLIRGRLVYKAKAPPDFVGQLIGGRAVAFDAKHYDSGHVFPFDALADHQGRDLELCHRLGGVAFVAFRLRDSRYIVPWSTMREAYWVWRKTPSDKRVQASIPVADMLPMPEDGWLSWAMEVV